jgi:exosortase A
MKSGWRITAMVLACSVMALIAAYWETAVSIASQWRTSTYSHAIFVIPASLYLAWRRREQLAQLEPRPTFAVLAGIPVLAFVWLMGEWTETSVVQQFCLAAMIVAVAWGVMGTRAARTLAAPLAFLFFAVPAGDSLIPLLQDFSAWFAVKFLDLTRVPVLLEGRIITIPSGRWEVAEACSGIHYLLATLTIGFIYADLVYRRWGRKVLFLAACAIVPVVANGVRVYGILMTDYLGGTKLARGIDHLIAGWLFLSVITLVLFAVGMRWREDLRKEAQPFDGDEISGEAAKDIPKGLWVRSAAFALAGVILAGAAPAFAKLTSAEAGTSQTMALRDPVVALPWSPSGARFANWKPELLEPNGELSESYSKEGRWVEIYVAYYEPGGKNSKLVSTANSLYARREWQRTGEKRVEARIGGQAVAVRQLAIRSVESHLMLWSWYWVDGEFTSNDYKAKSLLAWARLKRSRAGSAVIVLATEDTPTGPPAGAVLKDFSEHLSLSETLR